MSVLNGIGVYEILLGGVGPPGEVAQLLTPSHGIPNVMLLVPIPVMTERGLGGCGLIKVPCRVPVIEAAASGTISHFK